MVTIDLEKAFNSLDHDFLLYVLKKFGDHRISNPVLKTVVLLLRNFTFKRGASQDDPISAYLFTIALKSDSHLPKNFIIICFNDSPSKMMKNAFYFILKALFVLKIFKFLS